MYFVKSIKILESGNTHAYIYARFVLSTNNINARMGTQTQNIEYKNASLHESRYFICQLSTFTLQCLDI